jgi:hypothetical protein
MDEKGGCNCFNSALVDHALKKKKSSLHSATCPFCHKIFSTNHKGDKVVCFDCQKGLKHKVEVLGIGGKKFNDTLAVVAQAVLGTDFRVLSITDIDTILTYGVAVTPAVVIDGEVVSEGRVPEYDEIRKWIHK